MQEILISSFLISGLHGLLPNHWLPIIAVGRARSWTRTNLVKVTLLSAMAHAVSTILLGVAIAMLGARLSESMEHFLHLLAPIILVAVGLYFIYRHYRHQHFHIHPEEEEEEKSERGLILALVTAMFFSPCLEIEAIYFAAGATGMQTVLWVSLIYFFISVIGMLLWVVLSNEGMKKLNWHSLEHNAGIISGLVIILTGIFMYIFH